MGLGIDIERIGRFAKITRESAFARKYFSEQEREYCFSKSQPKQHLAARFAVKEAYFKATNQRVDFKDISAVNDSEGRPRLLVLGKKKPGVEVSISHSGAYVVAVAVTRVNE